MDFAVIVTAAGSSRRMGDIKKEYCPMPDQGNAGPGLTVLGSTVLAFTVFSQIRRIVITIPDTGNAEEAAARASLPSRLLDPSAKPEISFVPGGKTRQDSVHRALAALVPLNPAYVLIHDGARPWISYELIERIITGVIKYQAVIPVLPLAETPKKIDDTGFVRDHLKRPSIALAQTPQAFAYPAILEAHERAAEQARFSGTVYTDDAEIWGEFQGPVAFVPGAAENRKITFPGDLR